MKIYTCLHVQDFFIKKKNLTVNLTVLMKKGDVYLFDENLREIGVYFKTRGGVGINLTELNGGECNFLLTL